MGNKRRVVITGMGTVNPLGHNVAESWQAVQEGVCGIDTITLYDPTDRKVKLAAEVKDFDPSAHIDKRELRHLDRYVQLALVSALEAYRQSQEDTFSWYLSQHLPKVQDARTVLENGYLLFFIGENADQAEELFHTYVEAQG